MNVEDVNERTTKTKEDDIESKKHKTEKGAVHNVTGEPKSKCVVCHGPHHALRIDGKSQKRTNFVIVA